MMLPELSPSTSRGRSLVDSRRDSAERADMRPLRASTGVGTCSLPDRSGTAWTWIAESTRKP